MATIIGNPIQGTETKTSSKDEGVKKEKAKPVSVKERFNNLFTALRNSTFLTPDQCSEIERIAQGFLPKSGKGGAGSARGAFYQVFGAIPEVGKMVSPADVLHLTDGKGAFTDKVLEKWATKGVPYGHGSTARVVFYRRVPNADGTTSEAYFKLEEYNHIDKKDGVEALED